MTSLPQTSTIQHATPEQAAQLLTSVPVFKLQQPETEEEKAKAWESINCLSKPAPRSWIASRVYATLAHYFTPDHEADLVKMIADDWADLLKDYPAWAISNACKWWLSRENQHHHRKPLPGDIQEKAHREMEAIRAARLVMARKSQEKPVQAQVDTSASAVTPEDKEARRRAAEEILRSAGFKGVNQ